MHSITPATPDSSKRPTLRVPTTWFVIWRVGGARPRRRHTTLEAAFAERTRLRKLHPSATFHIFELTRVDGGSR
jgi:hypothetical protein